MTEYERQLLAASQRGEIESFNLLVKQYEGRVYGLAYRMLGDPDAAADVAQETFFSAYRHLRSFRGGSFSAWLLRIATNACYDQLRARKRRQTISIDAAGDDPDDPPLQLQDQGEGPDAAALRAELAGEIQRGLLTLPEEQRVILILSDIQGLSYEEIAEVTGTQLGTVKSRLSRARAKLRDFLKAGELLPPRYRQYDGSS
ncbi:MAG: RNA polymerase subunit sigma-24 [Herpetosiphonaceae bacterium]|nr:MAG: RNA polymerase subunit sigma-24 [Herpetosiphonaceae bacterium]